jgi:ABC-type multidrug transport system fused ATPase/permease subunit
MVFQKLCQSYYESNKGLVIMFILLSSIFYMLTVILVPMCISKIDVIKNNNINLYILIAVVLIVALLCVILYFYKLHLQHKLLPSFSKHVRTNLVRNYLYKNKMDFKDANITSDINKIYEISEKMNSILLWLSTTIIPIIFISFCLILYMFYLFPVLGMVTLICNSLFIYFSLSQLEKLNKVFTKTIDHHDRMIKKLDNTYNNLFNIYLSNTVEETIEKNYSIEEEYENEIKDYNHSMRNTSVVLRFLLYFYFIISAIVVYFKYKLSTNFYSILFIIWLFVSRIDTVIDELTIHINNGVFVLNESRKYQLEKEEFNLIHYIKGELEVKNLTFSYDSTRNVFKDFSLKIKSGERIGILGQTGTGKSTLLKLFLRFYKIQPGVLFIDGVDIKTLNPDDIRQNICYINQRTILFNNTIAENIRYGSTATTEDVYTFLKKYNLLSVFHPDEVNDKKCLTLEVQSNGSNISLGMQKVIFLVRGMLQNAPIYFIDEPFTSIDKHTRKLVQNMIDLETKGKTVIIITHDTEGLDQIIDRFINL